LVPGGPGHFSVTAAGAHLPAQYAGPWQQGLPALLSALNTVLPLGMMCLGIPGQIKELFGESSDQAVVEVSGARRKVNVALLEGEELRPGDWVLIHVGFALARLDEAEADRALRLLEGMAATYTDELEAMASSQTSLVDGG
jgi:hydrogenase expression/formation protein HypC